MILKALLYRWAVLTAFFLSNFCYLAIIIATFVLVFSGRGLYALSELTQIVTALVMIFTLVIDVFLSMMWSSYAKDHPTFLILPESKFRKIIRGPCRTMVINNEVLYNELSSEEKVDEFITKVHSMIGHPYFSIKRDNYIPGRFDVKYLFKNDLVIVKLLS